MDNEHKGCVICLEDFNTTNDTNISYLPCMHGFHQDCFHDYITDKIKSKRDITCPLCRTEHFKYGHKSYEFIMNELGLTYNTNIVDNNSNYSGYTGINNIGNRYNNSYANIIFDNNIGTNNVNTHHSIVTIPTDNGINNTRRHNDKVNVLWHHYRYYVIVILLIIIISSISVVLALSDI
jgi:hypothetical protein